jgi:hypothetical protein
MEQKNKLFISLPKNICAAKKQIQKGYAIQNVSGSAIQIQSVLVDRAPLPPHAMQGNMGRRRMHVTS